MSDPPPPRDAVTLPPPPARPDGSEAPTLAPAAEGLAPVAADAVSIPGYQVLATLGRGGMGVVYRARQTKLGRVVALKMILAGAHAGADDLTRFRTEAEAIARLQHPNIVQVHEVGEHGGLPYFSLEYCPGGSLEKTLAGTPLPPKEAAALVEVLARAMQAAHEKGVIHRDLKPANVLFAEDGTPKVSDFGLAKKLDEAGQTASGSIMGTPSYMAPEQAGSKSGAVGPAADVYALGAILYECLTGRPPFKAATPLDTILQVVSDEPVPVTQLQPRTPRDLETICLKCLEKAAAKRYPSARDLAEDLRRFQADEPVLARPVGQAGRLWRWCRRNRAVAGLLAAVAAALLAGTAVAWSFAVRAGREAEAARREADRADREEKRAGEQLRRAEGLLYASKIALAYREWQETQPDPALRAAWRHLDDCPWDLHGWEHNFLYTLFTRGQRALDGGHAREVWGVAFSPDSQRLASAGWDNTVRVWDLKTGRTLLTFKEHTLRVTGVAFSPDGQRLASGSHDQTVKVWDAESAQVVRTFRGRHPLDWFTGVAFSPDGQRLATSSLDQHGQRVRVWDLDSGRELWSADGHAGAVFSPDGKRLAGYRGEGLTVWDATTGQEVLTLRGHTGAIQGVAFSRDGRRLASGGDRGELKVWDAATGQEVHSLVGHKYEVMAVAFSPDGKRLVSGGGFAPRAGELKVWDATTGQELLDLKGHAQTVRSVAFSPDGKRLASGGGWPGKPGELKVWDASRAQQRQPWGLVDHGRFGGPAED
jgi:WD40 repeat protein